MFFDTYFSAEKNFDFYGLWRQGSSGDEVDLTFLKD